jgi:hypothetical protein
MDEGPKLRKVVASGDYHIPDNIPLDGFYGFLKKVCPTTFLLGGDFIDAGAWFGWNKKKVIDVASGEWKDNLARQQTEFDEGNKILDEFDKSLSGECEKVFLTGNHEIRLIKLYRRAPSEKAHLDFVEKLRLKERGYKTIGWNKHCAVGYCRYIHGEYHPKHHALRHVMATLRPVRYFHLHTHQAHTIVSSLDSRTIDGECMACMCHLNPEWLQDKSNAWRNGFEYNVVEHTGQFFSHFVPINQNRFYWGTNGNGEPICYK